MPISGWNARTTSLAALAGVVAIAAPALAADGPDWLRFLGRLHPMTVHFPVALLLVAATIEFVSMLRKSRRVSESAVVCIVLGAVAAIFAAWFGWLNADQEPARRGSAADTLLFHRWIGISIATLASAAAAFALATGRAGERRWAASVYRVALFICAGLVVVGGHLGGTLVYDEGYLTEVLWRDKPTFAATDPNAAPVAGAPTPPTDASGTTTPAPTGGIAAPVLTVNFKTQIAPIFASRCIGCHGPDKVKGGLRLDARRYVFREDDPEAWVIIPNDTASSELVARITLPASDPDLMPNEGGPLTADQIALLKKWIEEGAIWPEGDAPISAPPPADQNAKDKLTSAESGVKFYEPTGAAPQDAIVTRKLSEAEAASVARAVEAIRARGGVALPVAAGSDALSVNLSILAQSLTDADLAVLDPLIPVAVWLDVSRTKVGDAGLANIARLAELRRLSLANTGVTDAGLPALASLKNLEYLNLVGTNTTDEGIRALAPLKNLKRLYLWKTQVTEAAAEELKAAIPGLAVDRGTQ